MEERHEVTEAGKSSEDETAGKEQAAVENAPSGSSTGPLAEKDGSASASAVDIERGEDIPTLGRRRTLAQKLRKRLTARSSFRDGAPAIKEHNLDDYPQGYPRLAAFVDIDTNTHLYRRFGYLRNRALLYVQDELVHLERQLAAMDDADAAEEPYRLASRSWDAEDDPKRKVLMTEIKARLKEYDELLVREQATLQMESASTRLHRHYLDYMWLEKPLAPEDEEFVYRGYDMVNLMGYSESNWLKPIIARLMMSLPPWLMKLLFKRRNEEATASHQYQLPDARLDFVVKLLVLLLSMILLLLPVTLLYLLQDLSAWSKLGIIFASTALFTASTLYLTRAKQHEVFVSLATYCAVLVVFIGNLPQP